MKTRPSYHLLLPAISVLLLHALSSCTDKPPASPAKPKFNFATINHLYSVDCVDRENAWLIGFNASVFHTSDSGRTWHKQNSGVALNLCDVSFVNKKIGWISGKAGTVLHTQDGGRIWTTQDSGTTHHLFAIAFVDKLYGWAVGDFGTIIHTFDGGKTWTNQGSGEDRIYNDVFFDDRSHGWVVGEYGLIYHTSDSGRNWVRQECKDITPKVDETQWESFAPTLYSVFFTDRQHGWATGMDGTIIITEDGGALWEKVVNPAEPDKVILYKINIIGRHAWAVGDKGTYLYSRDRGRTWQSGSELTNTKFWLRDLDFCDKSTGFAVGARGTIIKTEDGGQTWSMSSGIPLSVKR